MSSITLKSSVPPARRVFTLVPAARPNLECAAARTDSTSTTSRAGERDRTKGVLHQLKRLLSSVHEADPEVCPRGGGVESLALLFQTILQEDRLTPLLRVWIARLQTPVMQQALSEPDSFQDGTHPARRLLSGVGSCAMGLSGDTLPCGALEHEVKRLVLLIEQYPDSGKRVYEQANEEFINFLTTFGTDPTHKEKVDCVICQKDQKEALSVQYAIALRDLLKEKPVQAEIREFLFKVWTEVLAVTAVRKGLQHTDTLLLKKTAIDLICANGGLIEQTGHAYAIRKIPLLLQRLRAGMTLLGLPIDDRDAHINMISGTLAKAFSSRNQDIATATPSSPGKLPGYQEKAINQRGAYAEELSGLEVIEDDPATTWRLWDCALVAQDLNHSLLPVADSFAPADHKQQPHVAPKDSASVSMLAARVDGKPFAQRLDEPLKTIELHHQRVAGVIRSLWSRKECGLYINQLILDGGDGMGHDRIGFNPSAAQAMMALANFHATEFRPAA